MTRPLLACAVVCLTAFAVSAADATVDSAVATFKQVEGDQGKLTIYCEMSDLLADQEPEDPNAEPKEDPAVDAKVDGYLEQLGPDFEAAWEVEVDENSADGKKMAAAVDALDEKCPEDAE